jgi:GNAT superfamily N-acetyltransferase
MKNLESLKELYLLSFTEDREEDADFLFENVFSKAQLISLEESGKTVSMLFLMDCVLSTKTEEIPYYYLYAACTHPDYRGKGLMGKLLAKAKDFAKENGMGGIILKPAKPSLFEFYNNYGFKNFCKYSKTNLCLEDIKLKAPTLYNIPSTEWWEERKAILKNYSDCFVSFPKELFVAAIDDCKIATDKKGSFVAYEIRDNTLLCKECIYEKGCEEGVLAIVKGLMEENKVYSAELRMPVNPNSSINHLCENGYFSVISNEKIVAENPYHGFAFD